MVATTIPAETRVLLQNISWQTFKIMLAEMGSERNSRFAYDNGTIEIMNPLMPHENSNRLIEVFVGVLCEELGLESELPTLTWSTKYSLGFCNHGGMPQLGLSS